MITLESRGNAFFCGEDDVVNPAKYTHNNNKRTTIHGQGYSIITTERDKVKEASHHADYYYY
jgi:hypothetical protein